MRDKEALSSLYLTSLEDLATICPDLSRPSDRMRYLISRGNRGLSRPYSSRSEAEVWAVMIDPAHGISEKYLAKGRHGDAYLSLTVGKARALALSAG